MADKKTKEEQIELLRRSVAEWNAWRMISGDFQPDLREANLIDMNLSGVNLSSANLSDAQLTGARIDLADLSRANLSGANLIESYLLRANLYGAKISNANFSRAKLIEANLIGADTSLGSVILHEAVLRNAKLCWANLIRADLRNADLGLANLLETDLREANLCQADVTGAILVQTRFEHADLTGCRVYGVAAWDVKLEGAIQNGLKVTLPDQPDITVSDLEVAQFIHLLVFNPKIRKVIESVTSKMVLILGRFTHERTTVLDAMRETFQHRDLVPVIFDFEKPTSRDLTETVRTLAHLAHFIVADITDPKSIPQELTTIIPALPSVPVQTVILASEREYPMYENWKRYPWVLPIFRYRDVQHLLESIDERIVRPAEDNLARNTPR